MNVYGRLNQLYQNLQQQDINEANIFRTEIEKVFSTNGLPPSLMHFLQVLDSTPWRDFQKCSSRDYDMAGRQVLDQLLLTARESRSDQLNLDLRPAECIRKIEDYRTSGSYEEFAVKVQRLMIHLDELVTDFPDRPKACNAMEQDITMTEQINELSRYMMSHITSIQEKITKKKEGYEADIRYFQEMPAENKKKLQEEHSLPFQELVHSYMLKAETELSKMKNEEKQYKQNFSKTASDICSSLHEQIRCLIKDIDIHRQYLKRNRVHQLKPVLPPVENLNELNRRCCDIFEYLVKLEKLANNLDSETCQRILNLKKEMVHNVFVVELQPPPVLKLESKGESTKVKTEKESGRKTKIKTEKDARLESRHESKFFSIGVRILGAASFVGLQVAADQLKFTVHIEKEQIAQVMSSPGHVDKSHCFCQINVGNKKTDGNIMEPRSNFRRIFEKLKLIQVPKPEDGHRQLFENVTDKKCAIIMSVAVANLGVVKVLCEPVVLTTATVQTGPALGTIFWDAAFSELRRNCYEEKDDVPWKHLAKEIEELFNEYIPKRPLTDMQLQSIALHLFKEEGSGPVKNLAEQKITRRDFMKEPKVEDSHWRWLFSCLNLIRQDPHDKNWEGLAEYWQKGLILGFVTKKEAEAIISSERPGTFLIRFRDTGIEKSNRDCPRASLSVVYRQTDDARVLHVCDKLKAADIQGLKLGNCLQQFKNGDREGIQFLYPIRVTFDEAFGEFIEEGNPDYGYARLVSLLVPPDKNLNNQVAMATNGDDQRGCKRELQQGMMEMSYHDGSPPQVRGNGMLQGHVGAVYSTTSSMIGSPIGSDAYSVCSPQGQEMVIQETMQNMTLRTQTVSYRSKSAEEDTQITNGYYVASSPVLHDAQSPCSSEYYAVSSPGSVSNGMMQQIVSRSIPPHTPPHFNDPASPQDFMQNTGIPNNQVPVTQFHAHSPNQSFYAMSPHRYEDCRSPQCMTQLQAPNSPNTFTQLQNTQNIFEVWSPGGHSNFVDDVMNPLAISPVDSVLEDYFPDINMDELKKLSGN